MRILGNAHAEQRQGGGWPPGVPEDMVHKSLLTRAAVCSALGRTPPRHVILTKKPWQERDHGERLRLLFNPTRHRRGPFSPDIGERIPDSHRAGHTPQACGMQRLGSATCEPHRARCAEVRGGDRSDTQPTVVQARSPHPTRDSCSTRATGRDTRETKSTGGPSVFAAAGHNW